MQASMKKARRPLKASRVPKRIPYRPEIRYFDATQASTAITSTPSTLVLTDMATGDAARTRDGPVINLLRITIRMTASAGSSNTSSRVVLARLLYDQATMAATDALENASTASMYNRDFVAPRREGNRMEILADWFFGQSLDWNTVLTKHWEIELSGVDKPFVRYLESNATNVPIFGALVLFFIGSSAANGSSVAVQSRVEFLDS